jgi:hypothetical protein
MKQTLENQPTKTQPSQRRCSYLYSEVENELACSITIPSCMVDDGELLREATMVEKMRSRRYTYSRSFVDERKSPNEG